MPLPSWLPVQGLQRLPEQQQFLLASLVAALVILSAYHFSSKKPFPAPYVGYRTWLEPTFLVRLRSVLGLRDMINEGYSKYKDGFFIVRSIDSDIVIMPNRYLEEIRLLPESKTSGTVASGDVSFLLEGFKGKSFANKLGVFALKMLSGRYTEFAPMLESDQHVRVIQNHLTPNLPTFLTRAEGALNDLFQRDTRLPKTQDWQEVNIHDVLERIVSEMTTRIFLGEAFTTDENWIKLCCEYPRNMFGTGMLLRLFPSPLKYLVSQMIPSKFSIKLQMREARNILIPVIEKIQRDGKLTAKAKSDTKPGKHAQIGSDDQSVSTLLEWMVTNASSEAEVDPKKLASRQLILTLASIHTSVMTVFFALFDLLRYPEYIEPLREEILALVKGDGDDGVQNLSKHDLNLLEKMDSFLAESQRFHPPIQVAPQRRLLQTLTLKDGTVLPKGIRIGLPCNAIHFDQEVNPAPNTFDGYRLYCRQAKMVQAHKDHLLFGYGRRTCPGRFWAVGEVKLILAKILFGMDFRLARDGETSKTYFINELAFPDPRTKLLMRARPKVADKELAEWLITSRERRKDLLVLGAQRVGL